MATSERAMHVQEPMTNGLPQDSLSKAIEAASKVNALLIASGKLKPAHAASENTQRVVTSESLSNKPNNMVIKKFDAEVEINDAPIICRDILTRKNTQEAISKKAGAYILTKGRYMTGEQRLTVDTTIDKPLFLYIQAETEANVQRAVSEINEIILKHGGMINQTRGSTISIEAPLEYTQVPHQPQDMPVVSDTHQSMLNAVGTVYSTQPNMSLPPPQCYSQQAANIQSSNVNLPVQMQFIAEKMYIGLEHAPPSFDVRYKILGAEGSFLQHIHSTSGAVVTLRGRNSGYLDPKTAQESTEPMHIHLKHMSQDGLEHAKQLANDLIKTVQNDYSQFQRQLALQPVAMVPNPSLGLGTAQAPSAAVVAAAPVLQPAQAAMVPPPSVVHSQSSVSCGVSGTLVTSQNGPPAIMGYTQQQERQVVISSAPTMSLGTPISVMVQAPPQHPTTQLHYSLSRPPTYVQAAPANHLITSGLVAHKPVGYNSLTSQGVEIVHQAIPVTRPLTSIQPLATEPQRHNQPIMTVHPVGVDGPPPGTILISEPVQAPGPPPSNSYSAPPSHINGQLPPVDLSQPPPNHMTMSVPVSIHVAPVTFSGPPPPVHSSIAGAPAYHVSMAPPAVISAPRPPTVMTSMAGPESRVIIMSQSSVTSPGENMPMVNVPPPQATIHQTLPAPGSAPPSLQVKPPDTVTYIVQQPVDAQILHLEAPDVSVPPPQAAGHMTAVVTEPPNQQPPHQTVIQPVPYNEFGQPVGPPLEVVHVQPSEMMPSHPPHTVHIEAHSQPGVHPSPHHISEVGPVPHGVSRYPTVVVPSTSNAVMIPNLMDVEIHNPPAHLSDRRHMETLPPIEPPPHLAAGDGYLNKRSFIDMGCEHRPPYIGSGRPYLAVTPPPPSSFHQRDGPMHKRPRPQHFLPPPPPPPP